MKKEDYLEIASPLPLEELVELQEKSKDGLFHVKLSLPTYEVFGRKHFADMFYRKLAKPGSPLYDVVFQMKRSKEDRDFVDFYVRGRVGDKMKYRVHYRCDDGKDSVMIFRSDALDESMVADEFLSKFKETKPGLEVLFIEEVM